MYGPSHAYTLQLENQSKQPNYRTVYTSLCLQGSQPINFHSVHITFLASTIFIVSVPPWMLYPNISLDIRLSFWISVDSFIQSSCTTSVDI